MAAGHVSNSRTFGASAFGHSPRAIRCRPSWKVWHRVYVFQQRGECPDMEVRIVEFPETRVAVLEHRSFPIRRA
jgi:AraC family transcriptional regulator